MYEVKLSNGKQYKLLDFAEINNIIDSKNYTREDFYGLLSDEIEKFYSSVFIVVYSDEKIKDIMFRNILIGQLKIEKAYEFLSKQEIKGNFVDYYKEISIPSFVIAQKMEKLKNGKLKQEEGSFCYDPIEIQSKYELFEEDKINAFYYLAFTSYFYEKYLTALLSVSSDLLPAGSVGEKNIKELNSYLVNVFSKDFSVGFNYFEKELYNVE